MGDDVTSSVGPLQDTPISGQKKERVTMGDAGSSVDPPQDMSQRAGIPAKDYQAMVELIQKFPQHWGDFRDIIHGVDLMTTKTQADAELVAGLSKIFHRFDFNTKQDENLNHFLYVSGYVEKSVSFARQILRDMNMTYVTELPHHVDESTDVGSACLSYIRNSILNCTNFSPEFCLRLTKTGFLHDLVEDVKHIQYMSADALETCEVFLYSLGTIQNCCMHPASAAAVRQMDIVPHLTPFLTKRGRSRFVQSVATAVLANVTGEDDPDFLTLDGELLKYFTDKIIGALSTGKIGFSSWCLSEILFNLCLLARKDFNRRLMVAQGTLHILHSVLDPSKERSEEEKNKAVTLISRLMEDQVNLQIFQNSQELVEVLKGLHRHAASDTVQKGRAILGRLEHGDKKADLADRIPSFPHVAWLLAEQYNLLSILHVGLTEFVLDKLKTFFPGEQGTKAAAHRDEASCQQVLLAVTELADDQVCQREIMSRGGLTLLTTVLQTGGSEEKTEAAKAVLGLTVAAENRQVVKINTDLTRLLEDAKEGADDPDLVQLADNILVALHQ